MLLGDARDAGGEARLTRARSATDVPFERTVTVVAGRDLPRARASAAASSTSAGGRWNASSGMRSTAAPEKSGR